MNGWFQNNSNDSPNNSSWFGNRTQNQRKSDDASKEAKAKICESNTSKPKKPFCNAVEEAMSGGTNKVNMLYSW